MEMVVYVDITCEISNSNLFCALQVLFWGQELCFFSLSDQSTSLKLCVSAKSCGLVLGMVALDQSVCFFFSLTDDAFPHVA